ncbi:hypothetical protein J5X84_36015 [Streptosporangiaceae bacterium NEAU-GS5]|nr:hypothetical protein [Streptosporangiaceae bacterium NEAU-GS5]
MPPKTRATTARKPPAKRSPKRKRVTVRSPVTVTLFQCKRCKLKTNNPLRKLFHTCMVGFTAAQKAAARRNLEAARKARRS